MTTDIAALARRVLELDGLRLAGKHAAERMASVGEVPFLNACKALAERERDLASFAYEHSPALARFALSATEREARLRALLAEASTRLAHRDWCAEYDSSASNRCESADGDLKARIDAALAAEEKTT